MRLTNVKKKFFKITKIIFINKKFKFFEILQKALIIKIYLYHYKFKRQLYVDFDELKRYEFEIMISYVFQNSQNNFFLKINIQLTFFIQIV